MVVPNLVFDLLVYGALWLGLLVDFMVPSLHGAATLVAVCAATYMTAEDGCIALSHRKIWTQDSLATALALSATAFIYYWWRNDSDLMAVVLHVGLMMASLMVLIALVSTLTAAYERKSPSPFIGLLATAIGAVVLGLLAGALVLLLTAPTVAIQIKMALLAAGTVVWKIREGVKPPAQNEESLPAAPAAAPPRAEGSRPEAGRPETPMVAHPGSKRMLVPQRGSLLDRFVPILLLGLIAFFALGSAISSATK